METTIYMACPLHAKPTNEQILIFKNLIYTIGFSIKEIMSF
jgi:hypothetical protein